MHFIVWRDNILLFGSWGDWEHDHFWEDQAYEGLRNAVLAKLPAGKMVHFAEIADALGELPWDVLRACRNLAKQKLAIEGKGKNRQHFRRRAKYKKVN